MRRICGAWCEFIGLDQDLLLYRLFWDIIGMKDVEGKAFKENIIK